MDLTLTTESYGGSKLSWLGSRRGVDTARTVTILRSSVSGLTGSIPAGTPLAKSGQKYVPYTGAEGQVLAGFLLTDQGLKAGGGDIVAPLLDTGRVIIAKLPVPFTAPADPGQFVFI